MLKLLKVNCECPQQPNSGLGDLNADDSSCRPEFGMEGESEDALTFLLIFVFALKDLGILQFL